MSWNSLCRPDGLNLRDSPASASKVLGLKVCVTTAWLFLPFYLPMYQCFACMYVCAPCRGQKRASNLLELELNWVVTTMCMLGTEPGFSARTVSVLNCTAISPAPTSSLLGHGLSVFFFFKWVCVCPCEYVIVYMSVSVCEWASEQPQVCHL